MKKHDYDESYFADYAYQKSTHCDCYFSLLSKLIPNLKDKKLLDIGCATGLFIKNFNCEECLGIDISKYAIMHAQQQFPTKRFKMIDLNKESLVNDDIFDLITMFDVIEHLYNFLNLKQLIEDNLAKNGYLIVTTPNSNSVLRFISLSRFTGEIDDTHTILFTPYTLDFFLRRIGLKKVCLFTPYRFYNKNNFITRKCLFGGQVFAIYKK